MNCKKSKINVLIVPHWRPGGGAGFYIRDLIAVINKKFNLRVGGVYAQFYDSNPLKSKFVDSVGRLSLPAYSGIGNVACIFHLFRSLVSIMTMFACRIRMHPNDTPHVFIYTSSVQALAIPVTRWFYPRTKITIAIQEEVDLSSFFGKLVLYCIRQSNMLVSISKSWALHARSFGLNPFVYSNAYPESFVEQDNNQAQIINSDLLYVGGDAKIKGFDGFLAVLPNLLTRPNIKILCLGEYSPKARKKIDTIKKSITSNSELLMIGHVSDVRPFLRGTRLLLLPVGSPHFCRPAIEAGLFSKTFVISDFDQMNDFAMSGKNCLSYNNFEPNGLVEAVFKIIDNDFLRRKLEFENRLVAQSYIRSIDCDVNFISGFLIANNLS